VEAPWTILKSLRVTGHVPDVVDSLTALSCHVINCL